MACCHIYFVLSEKSEVASFLLFLSNLILRLGVVILYGNVGCF